MSTHLSVAEIFRKLEERMKLHEERAAFHSQREIHPGKSGVSGGRQGCRRSQGRYANRAILP